MSQIENNLNKDEEIVAKAETTILGLVPNMVKNIIAGLIIGIILALTMSAIMRYKFTAFHAFATVATPVIILTCAELIKDLLTIKFSELAVTTNKIFGKTGIISTKIMDAPLNKINNVSVEQNLFGRLLGYGKISITTSSGNYIYFYIKNPDAFRLTVMNQIDIYDNERVKKQAEELTCSMANG